METDYFHKRLFPCLKMRSYPTYEEWKLVINYSSIFDALDVLILPMRNGNKYFVKNKNAEIYGSYPTYEEWKHK